MQSSNLEIQTSSFASTSVEPTIVTLAVSDPEVLLALSDYPEGPARTTFLVTSLKVGVLALKAARGTLDSDTLRREGDRVMEELGTRLNNWRAASSRSAFSVLLLTTSIRRKAPSTNAYTA